MPFATLMMVVFVFIPRDSPAIWNLATCYLICLAVSHNFIHCWIKPCKCIQFRVEFSSSPSQAHTYVSACALQILSQIWLIYWFRYHLKQCLFNSEPMVNNQIVLWCTSKFSHNYSASFRKEAILLYDVEGRKFTVHSFFENWHPFINSDQSYPCIENKVKSNVLSTIFTHCWKPNANKPSNYGYR